ncbi:MAG: NAD(P)/FAD-dependent oxidoreductase [Caulobacteraceae bacterium]
MSLVRRTVEDGAAEGLARLAEAVRRDLDILGETVDWVKPHLAPNGERALDVAIVGGGQSGLGAAFGLRREGVRNLLVLDENDPGLEGPWVTYARMITLRTPKHLTGLDFGIPSLTFRSWWEAQAGAEGWAALGKIPREAWMAYLRWYREVLGIPVANRSRVTAVEPWAGLYRLSLDGAPALWARKVIFATGVQGGGEWHTPGFIRENLRRDLYAHTAEPIDFAGLKGTRIAILGGGASAFDNAQHALGQGAAEVHVFLRRSEIPRINPIRHMEQSGVVRHFAGLDDAHKYAAIDHFLRHNQPPTNDTFERAAAYPGFRLHLASPWNAVRETDGAVEVTTPKGVFPFDFLILSTGLLTDVALRPELQALAGDIACWRDRFTPPAGNANPLIDDHPYLGDSFEFTGKTPEADARVHGLFAFNYSALASLGLSASALSGMKAALPRLAEGVARQLFLDDRDALLADYMDYAEPEFLGQWPAA